jgi:translation elongation factor EF-1alpha
LSRLLGALIIETFQECAAFGKFTVRDMKQTVGIGVVRVVEERQVEAKRGR